MAEVRTVSETGGAKGTKPQELAWIDPRSIMQVAEVAQMGAEKYGKHNYRNGYEWSKNYNALQRHLHAFWGGEDLDPESGMPHMAHAGWHCLALLTGMREYPTYDDRYRSDQGETGPFLTEPTRPIYGNVPFGDHEQNRRRINEQAWARHNPARKDLPA